MMTEVRIGPYEELAVSGPGPQRKRRALAGHGMVTPLEPLTLHTPERGGEELHPGRSRLIVEHELVLQRPDRFRPCDPKDEETSTELRRLLALADRRASRVSGQRYVPRLPRRLPGTPRLP
jgi:hypothetical protein